MNEDLKIKHISCNIEDINKLRKSKYVQSDLEKNFTEIKEKLDNNDYVIFSGTPCQVTGLKMFLGKKYDRLLLIDIACHGVGSIVVFNKCKELIEKKFNKKIINYEFRYKGLLSTPDERYMIKYTFADNSSKVNNNDIYMNLFLNELCLRKSCGFNCIFRNKKRFSDVTIADFNGKSKLLPKLYDKRNYSTIIFNSDKSLELIKYLSSKGNLIKCSEEQIKQSNKIIFENVSKKEISKDNMIYNDITDDDFTKIIEKYSTNRISWKKYVPYLFKYIYNNIFRSKQ